MDLREARFKRRLSQWSLSKISGVHQSRISLLENGFISPGESERRTLAKSLSVKPEEISWPEIEPTRGGLST